MTSAGVAHHTEPVRVSGNTRRSLRTLMVAVLAATATVWSAAATQPANATAPPIVKEPLNYVALGSSFAAGPLISPVVDANCTRSGNNYPHLVAEQLGYRLTDRSCSGATTASILHKPHQPNYGLGAPQPPQIEAVTANTDLVTVTIGGNDVGHMSRLVADSCATLFERARGGSSSAVFDGLCSTVGTAPSTEPAPDAYAKVEAALEAIVAEVRSRSPEAKVVFVDYLRIVPQDGTVCDAVPLTPERAKKTVRIHDAVADATARAAKDTGAQLVRASQLGVGHSACSDDPWLAGFEVVQPGSGGAIFYHPNAKGMAAVADQIVKQIS
ncbi:MAG: SGNH/GDSL hydrolase family protein [Rhodococcus sp.]|nr:SGNH/GDSL hydrolase family protein [Rhodococcus sp. (in: high G+C Gram-positive bacteria)]